MIPQRLWLSQFLCVLLLQYLFIFNSPLRLLLPCRYFHCSLIGYFLGLLTATVSSEFFKAAQPALLYLVPFTLLPLLVMAYLKGDLRRMWDEPFLAVPQPKQLHV